MLSTSNNTRLLKSTYHLDSYMIVSIICVKDRNGLILHRGKLSQVLYYQLGLLSKLISPRAREPESWLLGPGRLQVPAPNTIPLQKADSFLQPINPINSPVVNASV